MHVSSFAGGTNTIRLRGRGSVCKNVLEKLGIITKRSPVSSKIPEPADA